MTDATQSTPFEDLGGQHAIFELVHRFYDDMEVNEPALAATHRLDENGKVNADSRFHFALFLCFWTGGPPDYLQVRGHPQLRMRHAQVRIGTELRDAWLRSMTRAMDAQGIDGKAREYLDARFAQVADFLRNIPEN